MNTVFVGGSRQISKLPSQVEARLENLISSNLEILVGDANGADKAVQKFFAKRRYHHVTVFCSGDTCRNNVGKWSTRSIEPNGAAKGFQFYAAKDREMAQKADFGLMLWDGKSAGTVLNILRLIRAGKKAVLYDMSKQIITNFKTQNDWKTFLKSVDEELVEDLKTRATPSEWVSMSEPLQPSLLDDTPPSTHKPEISGVNLIQILNRAIDTGNPSTVVDVLGNIARDQGMTQLAKETGLARESLYRALSTAGNPEFATIFRVLNSLGLRLRVTKLVHDHKP